MSTPNMGLELWPSGALQPEVPVNATFQKLDALVRPGGVVQDVGTTTPPSVVSGDIGKSWVVGVGATGDWAGHDDDIALLVAVDLWAFITPNDMWRVGNIADETDYVFSGSSGWTAVTGGSGSGDVVGPASSVAGRIATFLDTTGKAIADSGKSVADLRAPNIQAVTSSATVTPTFDNDMVKITAQAAGLTLANPTGTAIPGLGMVIRIKDNGTARSISYGTQYRAIGITLPSTTVINKTTYIAMIYNSDDTTWDCIATGTQA